jgi:hypothetical protein
MTKDEVESVLGERSTVTFTGPGLADERVYCDSGIVVWCDHRDKAALVTVLERE